ncbi:preprotein translocase subunit SecY [Streptomyces sp. NPDC087440]|uniref:preprotein translocase subunit SecY n=1 Tax=Streptomyces sp. NPDC087440 TaxID=3365790 RepID=UPI0037FCA956
MSAHVLTTPASRRRLLVTLLVVVLFRLGQHLPLPGVDTAALAATDRPDGQLYGLLDLLTGGGLANLSVLALGVVPVLAAHWLTAFAGVLSPRLRSLAEAGRAGEARVALYARYVAVLLGAGLGYLVVRSTIDGRPPLAATDANVLPGTGTLAQVTLVACLAAGTAVVLWLSAIITRHGIGEGLTLLLLVQVAAVLPGQVVEVARAHGGWALFVAPVVLLLTLALATALVLTVRRSERRIPIQYAKRMIGRRAYGGTTSYVPIRGGRGRFGTVLVASLVLLLPAPPMPWLVVAYAVLVFFGAYVRGILDLNVVEVTDKLKREGAFVPGIRPGRPTAEYLGYIHPRITLVGALATTVAALLPVGALALPGLHAEGAAFGVTALIVLFLLADSGSPALRTPRP